MAEEIKRCQKKSEKKTPGKNAKKLNPLFSPSQVEKKWLTLKKIIASYIILHLKMLVLHRYIY